jgi:hypothetical protein
MEVYLVWICVYSFFKVSCDIYVPVCVSLDLFWYCVVMECVLLADSFCATYICVCVCVCVCVNKYIYMYIYTV